MSALLAVMIVASCLASVLLISIRVRNQARIAARRLIIALGIVILSPLLAAGVAALVKGWAGLNKFTAEAQDAANLSEVGVGLTLSVLLLAAALVIYSDPGADRHDEDDDEEFEGFRTARYGDDWPAEPPGEGRPTRRRADGQFPQ